MNTYEKQGEGGAVIVNQTPDEGCLSRATIGNRGISPISDKDFYPEGASRRSQIPALPERTSLHTR